MIFELNVQHRTANVDFYLVGMLSEIHRHNLGNTLFSHGNTEQGIRKLHRALIVGDHNDLRFLADDFKKIIKAKNIGIVKGGIDFIHQAKGCRFDEEYREDEGDG